MKVDHCRLCKTGHLSESKLTLPATPLANEYLKDPAPQELFPLEVCVCTTCGHYQLTESIDPARLFSAYSYVAGHSAANIAHFRDSAKHHVEKFNFPHGIRVFDIASNDGTLLKAFKELGMEILGIDPAQNLAAEANAQGITTVADFFTAARATALQNEYGVFDLVTANNVFAHVPDLEDFAKGVKTMLAPEGVFSFEVSYFVDVCDKALFDTIYHEHSSYHTLTPLIPFFERLGMEVFDVEHLPNHGGSVRVYVRNKGAAIEGKEGGGARLKELLEQERTIEDTVSALQEKIDDLRLELLKKLNEFKAAGKSIAIYGVPAKATTLMYAFGLNNSLIDFAIDDAPLKQGLYTPGAHIPIVASSAIGGRTPDVLLVLAWNFAESIMQKHPEFKGVWIVPLPKLTISAV